jgi:hypothetical protein
LGVNGILVGKIPCKWATPPRENLDELHQLRILRSLRLWLLAQKIPNDLTGQPWANSGDDDSIACSWAQCDKPRVTGYEICRGHILRGYLDIDPAHPSNTSPERAREAWRSHGTHTRSRR